MKIDLEWASHQTWKTLFKIFDAYIERENKREGNKSNAREMTDDDWLNALNEGEKEEYSPEEVKSDYEEWLKTLN